MSALACNSRPFANRHVRLPSGEQAHFCQRDRLFAAEAHDYGAHAPPPPRPPRSLRVRAPRARARERVPTFLAAFACA